jgi:hypothetical protein
LNCHFQHRCHLSLLQDRPLLHPLPLEFFCASAVQINK